MRVITIQTLALCFALGFGAPAPAAPPASGSFHNGGKDYAVSDALAFHGADDIQILLSEKGPLDAPQLLSNFTIDGQDQIDLDGASLLLSVYTKDGSSYSMSLQDANGGGGDLRCSDGDFLKITRLDDTSIAGSFICEEHKVLFDLPLLLDRPGTKLGTGGGEPGEALRARAAAIAAGDLEAFVAHSSPDQAAKARAAAAQSADELASKFRYLGRVTPPDVEIFGGTQVEERAWLDFANADRSVAGTMQMLRKGGRWLVDSPSLRQQ